jgi:hypothetical protein
MLLIHLQKQFERKVGGNDYTKHEKLIHTKEIKNEILYIILKNLIMRKNHCLKQ